MPRVPGASAEPCEKHDVSNCAYCRPTTASVQQRALARPLRGPLFTASFGGDCSECDNTISSGDQIRADGHGDWLCTECSLDGAITDS